MAWQLEPLADGQLPGAKGTLYTAAGPVLLGEVVLVNATAGALTVNVYVNRTGTSRRIIGKDISLAAGGELRRAMAVALLNGDLIEGDASGAASVDYVLSGAKDA